ncbi:MAG: hypothetical protein M3Z23_17375 [Acidobacteriota bacterium]|nr:hypothetical protein [Acidobacteriota bacterium]
MGIWWLKLCLLVAGPVALVAFLLRTVRAHPEGERWLNRLAGPLLDQTGKEWCEAGAVVLCILIGLSKPGWGSAKFERAERAFLRVARHRRQAVLLAGILPVLIRLALLPALPPPRPKVADEFGHLLIAGTFASGRVTNPPHPMWRHFESLYVLQQPTYTSIYPIAQGLLLAAAEVLRVMPWLAVYASAGAMCAAICWMLQGWLSTPWALVGALLAIGRFTVLTYWMNTYWGGALPAIGGALVMGALPRILRFHRVRNTVPLGIGLAILAQSRPFEGFLLSLPVAAVLLAWLATARSVPSKKRVQILISLVLAAAAIFAVTAFYNWRVTGNPLLMPYQLHQRIYGTPQSFFWSTPVYDAPGLHRNKDIVDNFHWQLRAYVKQSSWAGLADQLLTKANLFWSFYFEPLLTLPLLFLPFALKERWTRLLVCTALFVLLGIAMYPFFYYHYAAPICGITLFAVVQGMRRMRAFEWRAKPVGRFVFHATLACSFAVFLISAVAGAMVPAALVVASTPRSAILDRLRAQGGKHLVLVRYNSKHSFHSGDVYNAADIDKSDVVWARELDSAANEELLRYYAGRNVWLFQPDEEPPRFVPVDRADVYNSPPSISTILNGAGIAASSLPGVTPGGIVTIFGHNFARDIDGSVTLGSIFFPLPLRIDSVTQKSGNVYAPTGDDVVDGADSIFSAPLPLELANVRVQIGGRWAPIYSVANIDGQESITVQAPFELTAKSTTVKLWLGSDSTIVGNVPVLPASPGILQARMSESSLSPVILRTDGSFAAEDNPAKRGERVRMLVTGLGPMNPAVASNRRGGLAGDARVQNPVAVEVNGVNARVVSAKYAAGLIGIEEVVFEIPADCPAGARIPVIVGVNVDGRIVFSNVSAMAID